MSFLGVGSAVRGLLDYFRYWRQDEIVRDARARIENASATAKELENVERLLAIMRTNGVEIAPETLDRLALSEHIKTLERYKERGVILYIQSVTKTEDSADNSIDA